MAQIAIPESIGREVYYTYFNTDKDFFVVDMLDKSSVKELKDFLKASKEKYFVVKPDYIISKRGKNNLLGIKLTADEVLSFVKENTGRKFNTFSLNRFLILPFVPHSNEFYISISANAYGDEIVFSENGGVDIEENWKHTKSVQINILEEIENTDLDILLENIKDTKEKEIVKEYITALLHYFQDNGFAFLEINPFVIVDGQCILLDFKGRLDDSEFFNLQKVIDIYTLLEHVHEHSSKEEQYIKKLDGMTGASLKLKMLNRNGRIWPMISGGGASIIYFDSLVGLGLGEDIAFYGEYSGNPPFELTYEYAKTVLDMMLQSNASNKVLLIAGANANFTDIAKTFKGIEKALEEKINEIINQHITILIRRGGPNVKEAFKNMEKFSKKYNIPIVMEGTGDSLATILQKIK